MSQYYFSGTTLGFYVDAIHGKAIPPDAVPITEDAHAELLAGQCAGMCIRPDDTGYPVLREPEPAPDIAPDAQVVV